jgi:hypothetical protein
MSFVRTFADAPAVSRAAARDVVELAGDAIVARSRFTVALSGGSTRARCTSCLRARPLGLAAPGSGSSSSGATSARCHLTTRNPTTAWRPLPSSIRWACRARGHFELAIESGCSGYAAPLGFLEATGHGVLTLPQASLAMLQTDVHADEGGKALSGTQRAGQLQMKCPRCQQGNPTGKKFCGDCGAEKISTSKNWRPGERKQVTVLFADLKGGPHAPARITPCGLRRRPPHAAVCVKTRRDHP